MSDPTRQEVDQALAIVKAVADTIRELKEVPSGHLYARVMGHMSYVTYESIVGMLKRTGFVVEKHHVLTWVEPKTPIVN